MVNGLHSTITYILPYLLTHNALEFHMNLFPVPGSFLIQGYIFWPFPRPSEGGGGSLKKFKTGKNLEGKGKKEGNSS